MTFEKRYCKKCKGIHPHVKEKWMDGAARIFFGVFTLGFSEAANSTYYTCTNCEHKTSIDFHI